jgi:hypothetical protein
MLIAKHMVIIQSRIRPDYGGGALEEIICITTIVQEITAVQGDI